MKDLRDQLAEDGGNQDAEDRVNMVCIAFNTFKRMKDWPGCSVTGLECFGCAGAEPGSGGTRSIFFDEIADVFGQCPIGKLCGVEGILVPDIQIQFSAAFQEAFMEAL
ncbi:MAG TPA: hypothetical protein VMW15_00850 [Terracidiphilus sp.]|nr:hypothetical protein [Terracidiphilus sp.]